MATQGKAEYTGITTLEGPMGVRTHLSMYIGSTGVLREGHMPRALAQMMQEVISNAADEHPAGHVELAQHIAPRKVLACSRNFLLVAKTRPVLFVTAAFATAQRIP